MPENHLRNLKLNFANDNDLYRIALISKALSSIDRINILNYLNNGPKNINQIAEGLSLPLSTVSMHINILDDANLILTEYSSTKKGHVKLCSRLATDIFIKIWNKDEDANLVRKKYDLPVGMFSEANIVAPCGQAGKESFLISDDKPNEFFSPNRKNTMLLWFKSGYITYRFPFEINKNENLKEIEFSLELCSEVAFYKNDYPSDISFCINDVFVTLYTSPGDYGDKRGMLNPSWWPSKNTQYGDLLTIKINSQGVFQNNSLITNEINITHLKKRINDFVEIKISIEKDAIHKGGINIFGECFGNYKQNILMQYTFEKQKKRKK